MMGLLMDLEEKFGDFYLLVSKCLGALVGEGFLLVKLMVFVFLLKKRYA